MTNRQDKKEINLLISLIFGLSIFGLGINNILLNNNHIVIDNQEEQLIFSSDYWNFSNIEILISNDNWSESLVDWIQVNNGTKNDPHIIENITINKGHIFDGHCITIENSKDYFEIRNCSLLYAGILDDSVIFLKNSSNGIIKNNSLTYNEAPSIHLVNSSNITIFDNLLENNTDNSIFFEKSSNNYIENNLMIRNEYQIDIAENSNNNTIFNNSLGASLYFGIRVYDNSEYNNITNNLIYNTGIHNGIEISESNYNDIIGNNITLGLTGIEIYGSNHTTFEKNTIAYNFDSIIVSKYYDVFPENVIINNNTIIQGNKLNIMYTRNSIISNNIIYDMYSFSYLTTVLLVRFSNNTQIFGNRINSTMKNGLELYHSNNITTYNNTIFNSNNGIEIMNSNGCLINDTTISECNIGIYLEDANNNNITYNLLNYNNYSIIAQGNNNNNYFGNNTRYTFLEQIGIYNFNIIPYGLSEYNLDISFNIVDDTEILAESLYYNPIDVALANSLLFIEIEINETVNLLGDINITIDGPINLNHTKG
ncbi:MAG: right-handed parallel beta-helix repeat-containing protein [Candidatus Lokiarchaeota archaeon]|nr:right-handed parallel beta-helix repeat-containing protein [Candidatus Lokiarchaeota archaeon]